MNAQRWLMTFGAAMAVALTFSAHRAPSAQTPAGEPLNPRFEQLIDRYIAEGRGGGRTQGPNDMSAAYFEQRLNNQRGFLKDLQAIDRTTLSFDQDIDYRFLESILKGEIIQGERVKRWQQDPRQYLNTRTIAYKIMADPRPPAVRASEMVNDLRLQQSQLANARKNLNQHIPRWIELSTNVIDGYIVVLDKEVPAFANRVTGPEKAALLAETAKALAAVRDYRAFVNGELTKKPQGDYKIGADVYNALHESMYLFPEDDRHLRRVARGMPGFTRVPAFHDWGWKQFKMVEHQLEVQARKIDPDKSWLAIIREMKEDHPTPEALIFAHHEAARKTRGWVIDKDLVSIPWTDDDSTVVAADPSRWDETGLGSAPGMPTGSRSRKSAWTINPINPDWDDETAERNLSDKDYSYMYVVAPHEVYPGHFLMSLWKNENKRKLRRYESSYSNQAWCYYIEWELVPNYGFYPPDKQELYKLEMLRLKLWRMGRVVNDSGLHSGRMSYDDSVTLESERTGYERRRAQGYIDGITSQGSETAAPTLGYFEWMLLREDYFKRMRELDQKGTLKDFHDRIYKIGFLPVTLVREALFHELDREFRPRATSSQ